MKTSSLQTILVFSVVSVFFASISCSKDKKKDTHNAYAIGSSNNLLSFHLSNPSVTTSKTITGLQPGEAIVGIDFRPANQQLYALGSTSRLYTINTSTGQASAVSAAPFTTPLSGTAFGFDFNPSVDRIRIVSNTGQNMRVHPETGAVILGDVAITPPVVAVSAVAYNNNTAGAASTILFDIDPATDKLYKQDPANQGFVTAIGPLGIDVDGNNGFDISGTDNKAYALLATGVVTKLYSINLTTGAATAVGDFPSAVKGLALALNL